MDQYSANGYARRVVKSDEKGRGYSHGAGRFL